MFSLRKNVKGKQIFISIGLSNDVLSADLYPRRAPNFRGKSDVSIRLRPSFDPVSRHCKISTMLFCRILLAILLCGLQKAGATQCPDAPRCSCLRSVGISCYNTQKLPGRYSLNGLRQTQNLTLTVRRSVITKKQALEFMQTFSNLEFIIAEKGSESCEVFRELLKSNSHPTLAGSCGDSVSIENPVRQHVQLQFNPPAPPPFFLLAFPSKVARVHSIVPKK